MSRPNKVTAEEFNALGADALPGLLDIKMAGVSGDSFESEMIIGRRHLAPNGFLHAASVVALADTTCGFACRARLPDGSSGFTTIELKSNHMGTKRAGLIKCTASPLHLGRSTQVWDARVFDPENDKSIAAFRCTQIVLWPK